MSLERPERPPDVSFRFEHAPDAPRRARAAIEALLATGEDPIAYAVVVSASELVTNVIRHTREGGTLRVWDPKPAVPLRLEVEDHDPNPPQVCSPEPHEISGRGLGIVSRFSAGWGVDATFDGKIVWAVFDRTARGAREG